MTMVCLRFPLLLPLCCCFASARSGSDQTGCTGSNSSPNPVKPGFGMSSGMGSSSRSANALPPCSYSDPGGGGIIEMLEGSSPMPPISELS